MSRWADRWRSEANPGDGITPKISSTTGTNGTDEEQDAWLYDADWWRIKTSHLATIYQKPYYQNKGFPIESLRLS